MFIQPGTSFHLISLALLDDWRCAQTASQPTRSLTCREEDAHNCFSAGIDSASLNLERLEDSMEMGHESVHTKTETTKKGRFQALVHEDMPNGWIF